MKYSQTHFLTSVGLLLALAAAPALAASKPANKFRSSAGGSRSLSQPISVNRAPSLKASGATSTIARSGQFQSGGNANAMRKFKAQPQQGNVFSQAQPGLKPKNMSGNNRLNAGVNTSQLGTVIGNSSRVDAPSVVDSYKDRRPGGPNRNLIDSTAGRTKPGNSGGGIGGDWFQGGIGGGSVQNPTDNQSIGKVHPDLRPPIQRAPDFGSDTSDAVPGAQTPISDPEIPKVHPDLREPIQRTPDFGSDTSDAVPDPRTPISNPDIPKVHPDLREPIFGSDTPDADPGNPPADPNPGTPPADPNPGTPPADPNPGTPPVDPNPGTPPADPNPGTPPADPNPTDPTCPPYDVCQPWWPLPIGFPVWGGIDLGGYDGGCAGGTTIVDSQVTQTTAIESAEQSVATPAAEAIDLELLEVRQIDRGSMSQDKGPAYRVTLRNRGGEQVELPFNVSLAASIGRQPTAEAAFATVRVNGLQAGQTLSVDLRLPARAFALGRNADGRPVSFAWLTAVADSHQELSESNRENDSTLLARGEIAMVAQ